MDDADELDGADAPQDAGQVQVLARAARILRALEGAPGGLSLAAIAGQVGLPRSTVHRIVAALQNEGFLTPSSSAGGVRLGPALLRLAASMSTDLVRVARPVLTQLSEALEETVDLAVVRGRGLVFIDQIVGPQRLRTVSAVGETFPLYCTANGKAFLATLQDDEVRRMLGLTYQRRTPNTLTDADALLADLRAVRKCGVAFDHEEHAAGISAAGIFVDTVGGNPLVISVPVPTSRFRNNCDRITDNLRRMRQKLRDTLAVV
jgi:DNA-binding IclR family transcriptional regulator